VPAPHPAATAEPLPPPAPPPAAAPLSQAEMVAVKQQLKDSLTDTLYSNFDLFLYVSKAAQGPVAQRMFVFSKGGADNLDLRYDWIVSTGREKVEYNKAGWKLPSFTPAGYYELDPHRMYSRYRSTQWNMPMPHAMFFNWVHDGDQTGLAIHAAQGDDVALLGQRASGGCIHLAPQDAKILFDLIHDHYKGKVPRFAYDRKTHSTSNGGELMRDANGKLIYVDGYKVLVVIQDYGGSEVVATLM
jgi:lipoprotein-anchoring transpeptidase ErfK/SrfK